MAQFVTKIRTDLQGSLNRWSISSKMFTQDNRANRIEVSLYNNNVPVSAEGTIKGIVLRSDGTTVSFDGGIDSSSGGAAVAYAELPEVAYDVPGPISILIREITNAGTANEKKTVIAVCDAYVTKSTTEDVVLPDGTVIMSTDDLVAMIGELMTALEVARTVNPTVSGHTLYLSNVQIS